MSTITKPITVAEYDRMIEDGTIGEDDPVELIEGVLVPKMPRNPPHRVGTRKTAKALERMVPAGWYVAVQEAIVIELESKPEPDVSVVPAELEFDVPATPWPRSAAWWSRSPIRAWSTTGPRSSRSTPRPAFRSTGSST